MYIAEKTTKSVYAKFDNLADLLTAARGGRYDYSKNCRWNNNRQDFAWSGGECVASAALIEQGNAASPEVLRKAGLILDKIDSSFRDREQETWMPSVAGAYPIVPDYLIGLPECMRARRPIESDVAPIRLMVETSYSSGVTADAIIQRGTALAALIMRMTEERPVELHCFAAWKMRKQNGRHVLWTMPMDVAPVSLSQVLNTIACQAFCRAINFNVTDYIQMQAGFGGTMQNESHMWAFASDSNHSSGDRKDKLRKYFGLNDKDVLIERGYLTDETLMLNDPVQWVHNQLEKQRSLD